MKNLVYDESVTVLSALMNSKGEWEFKERILYFKGLTKKGNGKFGHFTLFSSKQEIFHKDTGMSINQLKNLHPRKGTQIPQFMRFSYLKDWWVAKETPASICHTRIK